MRIKDKDAFALAVVQSSDPKLSPEEKLDLYIKAYDLAKKHNDDNPVKPAKITSNPLF